MFPATNENPNFLLHRETPPFPHHQNPTSSTPDPLFLYFPSPFLDDPPPLSQTFSHHHHHHHPQQLLDQPANGEEPDSTIKKRSVGLKPRKRTGKKDRHSKIKTAQGVRDRRMRLSVQIARKFFDLQDMLGFDKASKTIEWLFSNSKSAIKELSSKHNANNNNVFSLFEGESSKKEKSQKTDCDLQERESSREKARARARERTKEKTMKKTKQFSSNPNNNSLEMEELGFPSNPSPFLEEEPNSYVTNLDLVQEKSSPHEASDSIASIFECCHNLTDSPNSFFMGNFLGNWDLDTDPRILISPFSGNPDSNI